MIFPKLLMKEKIIQTADTIRLDAQQSFVSKDEAPITAVEIRPEAGENFINIFDAKSVNWYLDWEYAGASRTVDVTVRVTTDGAPVEFTDQIEVITPEDDKLFSEDADLAVHETDIFKFLPKGKTSFKYAHRRAQRLIVEDFAERGVVDNDQNQLTKNSFVDIGEVKEWSIYLTLALIFEDNSNVVGDTFGQKAEDYHSEKKSHQQRAYYRIDLNNNGAIEKGELSSFQTSRLQRR